eukprot:g760.t1
MDNRLIAPNEISEMRRQNDIKPGHFKRISRHMHDKSRFPTGTATVADFKHCLCLHLARACPHGIAHGHNLERVLDGLPAKCRGVAAGGAAASAAAGDARADDEERVPVGLLLVAFSMAVDSHVDERVACLFDMLSPSGDPLTLQQLELLLHWLALTEQIPSNKRVHEYERWPYPLKRVATAADIIERGLDPKSEHNKEVRGMIAEDATGVSELQAFLKSVPVCAWGECLGKRGQGLKKWQDL